MGMIKTEVYWNLHKHLFSLRQKGRVIAHMGYLGLTDATFHVQPAGRARVLREGRKNVHAYAKGVYDHSLVLGIWDKKLTLGREITYNPYKFESFVYKDDLTPVLHSDRIVLKNRRIWEVSNAYLCNPI